MKALLFSFFLVLLHIKLTQPSIVKYVWNNTMGADDDEDDKQPAVFEDPSKNHGMKVKDSPKLKPKADKSKQKTKKGPTTLPTIDEKAEHDHPRIIKHVKVERIPVKKINKDLHAMKVREGSCMDGDSNSRKKGEEWQEKKDCNTCSCVCNGNGRRNCFCTRIGC